MKEGKRVREYEREEREKKSTKEWIRNERVGIDLSQQKAELFLRFSNIFHNPICRHLQGLK